MSKQKIKSIGTVVPIGDGATGKSFLTQHLISDSISKESVIQLALKMKKSLNVELEYSTKRIELESEIVDTTIQYYVFPGQKQKTSKKAPTFDEIVNYFNFLPALRNVAVLLMLYDSTRLESLKSLEYWLKAALERGWVSENTKIILVCTKIDLQKPNLKFVEQVKEGIYDMLWENNIKIDRIQVSSVAVSSITLKGIEELKNEIFDWVAFFGIQRVID